MQPIIILAGPTASGKTALALQAAKNIDAVIINCDSKQVYREIPVISAQPSKEERGNIGHELFGFVSVAEHFNVSNWLEKAVPLIKKIHENGKIPLLVGGTGLFINGLINGFAEIPEILPEIRESARNLAEEIGNEAFHSELAKIDPEMAARLEVNDRQRCLRAYEVMMQTSKSLLYWYKLKPKVPFAQECFINFFLSPEREKVYDNCDKRFADMVAKGALYEAENVLKMKIDRSLPAFKAHGLPELVDHLEGKISLGEAIEIAQKNTRHYIKRQFTWFSHQMKDKIVLDGESGDLDKILGHIKS